MIDSELREDMTHIDRNLPVIFHKNLLYRTTGRFICHWHETLEFLYFVKGEAVVYCNSVPIKAKKGDLIIVNSNELHQGESITPVTEYYCFIVDTSFFKSRNIDSCETKYINPIYQNRILFNNKVEKDKQITHCIKNLIGELENKETGFELGVKAYIFQLLTILLRSHVQKVLTKRECNTRMKNLERFNKVLEYMDQYYSQKISIDSLAAICNISRFHFCRLFREAVGMPPGDYLNELRIRKSEQVMREKGLNVTEAAMACGFDNVNYFSRLFKKYRNITPSAFIKQAN